MPPPIRSGLPKPPPRQMLDRPRLMDTLEGRFERRLTVLQAGAGFGKTTLLQQAIAKNHEEPWGTDLWLACRPGDAHAEVFAASLCRAVGATAPTSRPIEAVADALWKLSPEDVALILDDVHHLPGGSDAAAMLAMLLDELPENAHLVIASRQAVPLPTARLEAAGEYCRIDASELAFAGDEQTAFFAMRRREPSALETGGWPALCELAASAGADRVGDFLWEEVLAARAPRERRNLARLIALEWVDAERIDALTGEAGDVDALAATLPLAAVDQDGRLRFHALWQAALESTDPEWTPAEVERATDTLASGMHYREALELARTTGFSDLEERLLERLAIHDCELVDSPTLRTILESLPEARASDPVGRLLDGRFRMRSDPGSAQPLFELARDEAAKRGADQLEMAALQNLSIAAYSRFDAEELERITARCRELEGAEARTLEAMSQATRAFIEKRHEESLDWVDRARASGGSMRGTDGVVAAVSALSAGLPERALEEVAHALPDARPVTAPLLMANRNDALWLLGKVHAEHLAPLDDFANDPIAENTNQTSGVSGVLTYANAIRGRRDGARSHLARSASALSVANGDGQLGYECGRIALAMLDGEPERAAAAAEALLVEHDAPQLRSRFFLRALPMAIVASPAVRDAFDGVPLGPAFELGRAAALALRRFREDDALDAVAALPWEEAERIETFFVPSLFLELAVAAAAAGRDEMLAAARALAGRERDALRRLADRAPTRGVARSLLESVPAVPSGSWQLQVLGPLRLLRDGEEIDAPAIRRDRVRALLHYLAAHRSCRREILGTALWPELEQSAIGNNLRVNLNHLLRMLEPERERGEPSFFLSTGGEMIQLVPGGIEVDVDRFEATLERAERADLLGQPRRTLELLESALALYRGDYLEGAMDGSWGESDRVRLRARFVAAAERATSLHLAIGAFDAALARIREARRHDPLSEGALRLETTIHLRQGQRSAARSLLQLGIERLASEGMPPDAETRRLAKRLGVDLTKD